MSRKARKHGKKVGPGQRKLSTEGQKTNVGDPNARGPSGAKGSKGGR